LQLRSYFEEVSVSVLAELESAVGKVASAVAPSVVRIGRGPGRGAGVVIGPNLVLTNAHNLRGAETTITFQSGSSATGSVAGVDAEGDLAVISVETADAPAVAWEPSTVGVGAPVFAVANPAGRGLRVTFGLVSAVGQAFGGPRGRRIGGSVEHTAPLSRGSSGGPIVDGDGRLLGINTHRVGDGFYLAIPADQELKNRIDALSRGESPERPRLGVALAPAHAARRLRAAVGLPERDGLLVRAVEDGSPADRAGLRQGDLLVRAGDRTLLIADDLYLALESLDAAASLTLTVVRGAEELQVSVGFGPADDTVI
jgi:serine protease Do